MWKNWNISERSDWNIVLYFSLFSYQFSRKLMIMNYLIQYVLIWNISLICIDKLKYSLHVYYDFGYKISFPCRGLFKMLFESFRARYISIVIKSRLKLKESIEYTIKEQFFIHYFYYYLSLKLSENIFIF